ncbi:hypothetical protein A0U40_13405 [[Bacillus] sp. KCTC 13219]|nr:hypothetical protein A0U40_13405 [[Bacillus] sp. KCTC 13219]
MNEKVKVSREVAEALRTVLPNGNIGACIEMHVKGWEYKPKLPLNKLTTEEFARCCLIGYEIEETPEEKLLKEFELATERSETPTNDLYVNGYWNGIRESILATLDILGIKIKGIND